MLRSRKEPDPLSGRRKLLAEKEKLLAERMSQLRDQISNGGEVPKGPTKPAEPPVWRLEDDTLPATRKKESNYVNKRVLARQRQRDMIFFFVMIGALLIVVLLVVLLVHSHSGPLSGS